MQFSFIKVRKPKQFNYQPIFYDEAKEKRKERERRVREELGLPPMTGDEKRSSEERIRGKFNAVRSENRIEFARKTQQFSNKRLLTIILILFMLVYFIYSSGLEKILSFFKF